MENMTDSLFIPYFRSFIFESRVTIRRHLHPHLYRKGSEVKSIRHHPHCHTARKAITSALIQICLPTRRIAPRRHHRSKWKPPPLFSKKAATQHTSNCKTTNLVSDLHPTLKLFFLVIYFSWVCCFFPFLSLHHLPSLLACGQLHSHRYSTRSVNCEPALFTNHPELVRHSVPRPSFPPPIAISAPMGLAQDSRLASHFIPIKSNS